jgi:hypothetical protein
MDLKKRNITRMVLSLNCIILGDITIFPITLGNQVTIGDMRYDIDEFRISNLKEYILSKKKESKLSDINDPDYLVLWKVDVSKDKLEGVYTTEHIKNKLNGKKMEEEKFISNYFDVNQRPDRNIHIIVVLPTGKCLPMFYLSNKKYTVETMIHILVVTFVSMLSHSPRKRPRK